MPERILGRQPSRTPGVEARRSPHRIAARLPPVSRLQRSLGNHGLHRLLWVGGHRIQRQPAAGLRKSTIHVRWIDDDVALYHRIINAIAASRGFRGISRASLWQPFHGPILRFYRTFSLRHPRLRRNTPIDLSVAAWFDPTVFHGQVTGASVDLEQSARLADTTITGVLTPRDAFAGRSTTSFGVGEVVELSFTAVPAISASSLGGLRWVLASGGGTIAGGDDGLATFTAGANPGRVDLELVLASGFSANTPAFSQTISVVAPSDAAMRKDARPVKHERNTCSVGFCGETFLRPVDVSFSSIQFREGRTFAVATGFLSDANGKEHPTGDWFAVLSGNSRTGCQVDATDSVHTGPRSAPYAPGDFVWNIPWEYRVGTGSARPFTVAVQHATSDASGTATIEKKGAGPFSKSASDPTVRHDCY